MNAASEQGFLECFFARLVAVHIAEAGLPYRNSEALIRRAHHSNVGGGGDDGVDSVPCRCGWCDDLPVTCVRCAVTPGLATKR